MIHTPWCSLHGASSLVPSAWYILHGASPMVHPPWYILCDASCMVHPSWYTLHCAASLEHSLWYILYGAFSILHFPWYILHDAASMIPLWDFIMWTGVWEQLLVQDPLCPASCQRLLGDSSVAQSCPTLCNPMNRRTPGLPVHHHLPEFTQTHVHRVRDAIQPSYPLSSPSPPAPNPSQHQSLFQ